MARVTYITEEGHPELAELIGRLKAGRRGSLINIYRLLLNSPALAETWFAHANIVRWKTELSGRLRELVIIRVAYLNRCAYVLRQHVPNLALADGVSEAECDTLADWRASTLFAAPERAALAYADAMTREIDVADAVFEALRPHYSERQIVELTVLIATYNMLTRILQALQVDLEPT